uniref:ATPase AAA-type core domain-containing protein n=1 Tax=Pan paniscus TaxID=9597 RepID=A0A2R9AUC3_PANPA
SMVHADAFSHPLSHNEVVGLIFHLTIFGSVTYFSIKWMVDAIDPIRKQKAEAQKQAEKLMKLIGVKNVKLSEYEMSVAAHLTLLIRMLLGSDIAGLDETVILPIKKKHLFENSRLLQPPKGCGETLIAKATAKEAGCRFINLEPSTLTNKWYGESQTLAAAVFSLAMKLQLSIIIIDEIDSFLRNPTAIMKAQFMSLWDGLDTDHSSQVIVMGATIHPQDLDTAITRRIPTRFHINQPALKQKEAILKLILKNENVDRHVDLLEVAQETDAFSGRDLNAIIEKIKKSKDAAFQNVLTQVCLD